MEDDPELRRTLWFLLGGRRGGENKAKIIRYVREKPANLNQIAGDLRLQYKTIQHHAKILVKSSLLVTSGEKYGTVYLLSPWLEHHIETFDRVCAKLGFSEARTSSPAV